MADGHEDGHGTWEVVRVFRLTEDLPAIRPYLIPNLGKIPHSLNLGFVHYTC